jgi:hypothetical protein
LMNQICCTNLKNAKKRYGINSGWNMFSPQNALSVQRMKE